MTKIKKTYRLEEETVELVDHAADRDGLTATEIVEAAVCSYCAAGVPDSQKSVAVGDEALSCIVTQLEAKDAQLAAKDEQITALQEQLTQITAALLAAQESVKAAQALHAIEHKDELLLSEPGKEADQKRPWWKFWC